MRLVKGLRGLTYEERLNALKIPLLANRRLRDDTINNKIDIETKD